MIARFIGANETINGMLFKNGNLYNVEYAGRTNEGWIWFNISKLDNQSKDKLFLVALFGIAGLFAYNKNSKVAIPYTSMYAFYKNWELINTDPTYVYDVSDSPSIAIA